MFAQNSTKLIELFSIAIVVLFCLPIHEMSHGFVAYLFGDNTAKNSGRLTLNPVAHLDPMGLLAMIIFRIGWAKPVPVNPNNLKPQRMGQLLVAASGPLSNFLLSFLFFVLYFLPFQNDMLHLVLLSVAISNIWLGMFNLIPVLPLDGGQILMTLLPGKTSRKIQEFFYKYQGVLTVGLLVLFYLGVHEGPLTRLSNGLALILSKGAFSFVNLFF